MNRILKYHFITGYEYNLPHILSSNNFFLLNRHLRYLTYLLVDADYID